MSDLQTLLAQKQALDAQIQQAQRESRAEGLEKVKALMAEYGLTTADLVRVDRKPRAPKPVAPKYRDEAGNTWTGRGKQPLWLASALAGGCTLESFLIAKP